MNTTKINGIDNNESNYNTQLMALQIAKNLNENDNNIAFEALLNNIVEANKNNMDNNKTVISEYEGQNLEKLPMIINGVGYHKNMEYTNNINITDNSKGVASDLMTQIENAAEKASQKYGINKDLIMAIINHESGFQPNVTSSAGAQGLMQILPSNFASAGITNGYDVEQNINGGTYLLRKCMDLYGGDEKMGLIAYAGGCGVMQKRGVNSYSDLYKMPDEARKAVPEILAMYEQRKNS